MIKRIITFVLCLALCVSCVAIGLINQKANDADIAAGAISGAGNGAVDKISADLPEGATKVDGMAGLYQLGDAYYINSDINLVTGVNKDVYDKLVALIDDKANGETTVTIDGLGHTITTNKGLFKSIANVNIENLNIVGEVTVTDGDLETTTNKNSFGIISCVAAPPYKIDNVDMDVDVTIATSENLYMHYGNFVGFQSSVKNQPVEIKDCTTSGDVVSNVTFQHTAFAAFVGRIGGGTGNLFTYTNCVNNGNIDITVSGATWVGAMGGYHYCNYVSYTECLNTGNINVTKTGNSDQAWVGGFVGYGAPLATPTDCINLGDVTVTYTGESAIASINNFCVSGIWGNGGHSVTYTRCINAGDIKAVIEGAKSPCYVAGISSKRTGGTNKFIDCMDIGSHSATNSSNPNVASINAHSDSTTMPYTNCYSVAVNGYKALGDYYNGAAGSGKNRFFITLPENIDTLLNNIKTNGITDGAAVFSAILACADYDESTYTWLNNATTTLSHDNDDGMFLSSFEGFTVTADAERNDYFTTVLDKEYLENVKTILGVETVKFGAIITPATYVTKIKEFSHDAFDTYYENNRETIDAKVAENGHDPITALYVTAKFGDGADFTDVNGVYNAGIYLSGAYEVDKAGNPVTYAAKMYIQIGEGETANYVYSK